MIIYLPAVLSAVSLLVAYGSAGRRRQAATIGAIIATGWSLVVLGDANSGSRHMAAVPTAWSANLIQNRSLFPISPLLFTVGPNQNGSRG